MLLSQPLLRKCTKLNKRIQLQQHRIEFKKKKHKDIGDLLKEYIDLQNELGQSQQLLALALLYEADNPSYYENKDDVIIL